MDTKIPKVRKQKYHVSLERRFWDRVEKTDSCWLWKGSRRSKSYGVISVDGKPTGAHRVAYELAYGPIPKGMVVRHYVCDNPNCVNPKHLKLGTRAENAQDKVRKGRTRNEKGIPADQRFWSKVDKGSADECWLWTGVKDPGGYGRFIVGGKAIAVHRYSYERYIGPIPKGLIVRHFVCDNRACVNPKHLKLGTKADNTRDMKRAGRMAKGDKLSNLTETAVLKIRQLYREGNLAKDIAKQFGLATRSINPILTGQNWPHIAEKDGGNIAAKYGSDEWKERIGKPQRGRKFTAEHRRKLSEARKGKAPWNKGVPMSDETKKRVSEAKQGQRKGIPLSKEHRQAISEARKGMKFTEEHKANIAKGRWGHKHTKETREKMQKAYYKRMAEEELKRGNKDEQSQ